VIARRNIHKGKTIVKEDLAIKRPGTGIKPKYLEKIVGRTAVVDVAVDSVIQWSQIS
jgi:sialic acid synthase SpsE